MAGAAAAPHTASMTNCPCPGRTSVAFSTGVELRRCSTHDTQSWLVDGELAEATVAVAALRVGFQELRGSSMRRGPAARTSGVPPRVVTLPPDRAPAAPSAAALTALLHARGLQGSWATA